MEATQSHIYWTLGACFLETEQLEHETDLPSSGDGIEHAWDFMFVSP
jgi:hypothetical protein